MKKWEQFSLEEIKVFVNESNNLTELIKKLGYNGSSGYEAVHKMIQDLKLDTSHFKRTTTKGRFDYTRFTYGKEIRGNNAVHAIAALRGRECEKCGLSEWMGEPIPLEVHHIDGDRLNNTLENLQLLCHNCHAFTGNWRKRKTMRRVTDGEIIQAMQGGHTNIREVLLHIGLADSGANYDRVKRVAIEAGIYTPQTCKHSDSERSCVVFDDDYANKNIESTKSKVEFITTKGTRVSREELKSMVRTVSFTKIGEMFKVSDNAVRKWCKKLGLPHKASDIQKYSDETWELV